MLQIFERIKNRFSKKVNYKRSYSQSGEDLILLNAFQQLKIKNPSYIDIGAHDPTYLNNTQLFYESGSRGINIEPDPFLIDKFDSLRPLDTNLNIGIGFEAAESEADFYVMSIRTLNTFSKEEAEKIESYGSYKINNVEKIKLKPLNTILKEHFREKSPDLISLDIEGLDLAVLQSIDLKLLATTVFCIETINYTEDNSEQKNQEIIELMLNNNFFVYADTYINTIFINKDYWAKR